MNISERLNELLPADVLELLTVIGGLADREGREVFLVGGMVRDIIMGRGTVDVDVVVNGDGPAFAAALATLIGGNIVLHDRFGTSVLILPNKQRVDVATARTEIYSTAAALPDVTFSVIDYDLERRDFSINAIAVALGSAGFGELLDPFGGRADIGAGVIRVLHDGSFVDDPTRIFRAVRFEQRFGFHIDEPTARLLRDAVAAGYIGRVSGARVRNEVAALFGEPEPAAAVRRLQAFGVWDALVPGLQAGQRAIGAIQAIPEAAAALGPRLAPDWQRLNANLMALAADAGPEAARGLAERLGLSRPSRHGVVRAVTGLERLFDQLNGRPKPSALRQTLDGYSDAALVFLYAGAGADGRANIERYLAARQTTPLITGRDLVRLGFQPSSSFTGVLRAVMAAQLDGDVKTAAAARALAKDLLEKRNA